MLAGYRFARRAWSAGMDTFSYGCDGRRLQQLACLARWPMRFLPKSSNGRLPEIQVTTMIANADRSQVLRGTVLVAASAFVWSSGGPIVRSLESADAWTTIFWR